MRVFTKSDITVMWGRGDKRFIPEADAMAEITKLRAELEQERELADRLAACIQPWRDYGDYDCDVEALSAHATRRNK